MGEYSVFVLDTNSVSGLPNEGGGGPGGPGGAAGSGPFTITVNDSNWTEIKVNDTRDEFFNEHNENGAGGNGSQTLVETVTLGGIEYAAGLNIFTAYDLSGAVDAFGNPLDPDIQITTFHIGPTDSIGITGPVLGLVAYGSMPPGTYTFTIEGSSLAIDNLYSSFVCFCKGTNILTSNGERTVETLKVGDQIQTRDHGLQSIRWIGSNKVPAKGNMTPVRINAGALNEYTSSTEMTPSRDLFVSPQHRMLLEGWTAELLFGENAVLAAAKHLINDHTIRPAGIGAATVEYFHILFDTHEVIFAEGAPSESFHPGEQGLGLLPDETRSEILELFPELAATPSGAHDLAYPELKGFEGRAISTYS